MDELQKAKLKKLQELKDFESGAFVEKQELDID